VGPPTFSDDLFRETRLKKLVLYGDSLLAPSGGGYGEQLIDLLVMRRPEAAFTTSYTHEDRLDADAVARDLPVLIGKAPDFVYLALGTMDMLEGADPGAAFSTLESLARMLHQKTRAPRAVANVCLAFLPPEARPAGEEFNARLGGLADERTAVIDLNAPVNFFFEQHRRGSGEKRSLYEGAPPRLTSMGRVFLSHAAYGALGLEEFFAP
jgi:hypothetical protein